MPVGSPIHDINSRDIRNGGRVYSCCRIFRDPSNDWDLQGHFPIDILVRLDRRLIHRPAAGLSPPTTYRIHPSGVGERRQSSLAFSIAFKVYNPEHLFIDAHSLRDMHMHMGLILIRSRILSSRNIICEKYCLRSEDDLRPASAVISDL